MIKPELYRDLEERFRQRVASDNFRFGINSVYLPCPELCLEPDFCLIGMEPSIGKSGIDGIRQDIEQGFRNFLYSEEDFILHYCAYTYLCENEFRYYITDLSKGAMLTEDASKTSREERYRNWLPLLKEEIRLLGNPFRGDPKTIAIGYVLERQLNKLSFKPTFSVLHYSWSNSRWIKKRYSEIVDKTSINNLDKVGEKLRLFAVELMERTGYSKEMINRRLEKRFYKISDWKKALFSVYKHDFQKIRNDIKK